MGRQKITPQRLLAEAENELRPLVRWARQVNLNNVAPRLERACNLVRDAAEQLDEETITAEVRTGRAANRLPHKD